MQPALCSDVQAYRRPYTETQLHSINTTLGEKQQSTITVDVNVIVSAIVPSYSGEIAIAGEICSALCFPLHANKAVEPLMSHGLFCHVLGTFLCLDRSRTLSVYVAS